MRLIYYAKVREVNYRLGVVARIDAECHGDTPRQHTIQPPRTNYLAVAYELNVTEQVFEN
ncbi:hypothetical protein DPMN_002058 [Dreissena polymorpha]|uniref:Uncharacterized protein n=1 Tax=Dreissena polymorpha TaxID=45954 RepID=A0A9D4MMW6_DREPO|nr:hypothetical protein DPMN_002058 [Dreissena polymorpha]